MNGVLISYLDFSPIIVTLGGFAGARGVAEAITHDTTQFGFGSKFAWLGNGEVVGIPVPAVIFLATFLVGAYVWYEMPVGRHMTAIGADKAAARSLGVGVRRIPLVLYAMSGLAAAAGGLIITSELDGASLSIGVGLELEVLTAILLGGVAFSGGRGSLWGVLFGVLFVGVLDNGLILLNVGPVLRESRGRRRADRRGGAPTPSTSAWSGCLSGWKRAAMTSRRRPHDDRDKPFVLEVQSVTKRFGPVTALRDVNVQLRAGEVLGLIGDNGAGKSTLVNILCGALRADEGRLLVDGVERHFADPSDARAVGIETVFQNLALIPTLNIWENVYLRREEVGPGTVGRAVRLLNKRAMRKDSAGGVRPLRRDAATPADEGERALRRTAPASCGHARGALG